MHTPQPQRADWLGGLLAFCQQAYAFMTHDIWRADLGASSRLIRCLVYPARVTLIVVQGFFFEHQGSLRASALTYNTLLSIVPMLAFMLAFLKGLGVQNLLEPLLIHVFATVPEDTVRMVITYASRVDVRALGAIGLGTLVFTTVLQVSSVERALNAIWGVPTERPPLRKIADYASVLVLGPVAILLATGINTNLHNQPFVATLLGMRVIGEATTFFFRMLPYVILWLVFAFFYAFLPNTRVQAVPALIGGIVGGTLWQLTQWVYITFQVSMANAQAIYGALAQLPVLMLWLYASWVTTLVGAEVAFACQHAASYFPDRLVRHTSFYAREWLAHALYFSLVRSFLEGTGPWSALAFAHQYRLPPRLVQDIVAPLRDMGLLVETATAPEHYVPGRPPTSITPWHISQALRHYGDQTLTGLVAFSDPLTSGLMTQVEEQSQQALGTLSVSQWLEEKGPVHQEPPQRRPA